MLLYINNDSPQIHWMSEIQFNFQNHILLKIIIIIILLLKMANEQFKDFK